MYAILLQSLKINYCYSLEKLDVGRLDKQLEFKKKKIYIIY